MVISEHILAAISAAPHGAIFRATDFLPLGTRAAIDQALHRLVRDRKIARVARGVYAAHADAPAAAVASAVEPLSSCALPLSTDGELVVPTRGRSRTLTAAGGSLRLQRMSERKLALAQSAEGRSLLALWVRGRDAITVHDIRRSVGQWPAGSLDRYAAEIPEWLRVAIRRATAPRKSAVIGLVGAYDWSNPQIPDRALIGKVLDGARFDDVARLCSYYGMERVRRVARKKQRSAGAASTLSRMLRNIGRGLRLASEHEHAAH